ncbi:MAG: amidohydrolase family protein, partial [Clostridia bacterium]|nr:amidohydrolase family protein [Clostridia bacterium]
ISLFHLVELMSSNGAKILRDESRGTFKVGAAADAAVFDVETPFTVDPAAFRSKGRNTPFEGMTVYGKTLLTVCGGNIVFNDMQ